MQCIICNGPLNDKFGHNAEPVMKGKCCGVCNLEKVIPARIEQIVKYGYDKTSENQDTSNEGQ